MEISQDKLATFVCGSCSENCPIVDKCTLGFEDFDINLLNRPDDNAADDAMSVDLADSDGMSEDEPETDAPDTLPSQKKPAPTTPVPNGWLDPNSPEPPMPMANTPYSHMLLDPSSVEADTDTNDPVIVVCRRCRTDLKGGRVPALSMANRNYLGPVPQELQDLTVVEEAMISLCRAKCWIIQLREDNAETSIPISQRGVRGHIIVYPQKPSSIARTLPPSLDDIITPVCVIFVGSHPPTPEWLREKAKPLIVRKEKVLNALNWLKANNHLYRNIPLNNEVLDSLPAESILPFHVQHIVPNAGIDATTSDYIPGSAEPPDSSAVPNLNEILQPPVSNIPFQSVVVADVDGNAPASELRAAAVAHMKKPGSNYIEIPHGSHPANEFQNPHLFPMMYPTLFPYGLGGLEDKDRPTRLGFKRHVKHLFNLADRRFQEHYSFLFTAFNMIQR
jgi:hypothetical protein